MVASKFKARYSPSNFLPLIALLITFVACAGCSTSGSSVSSPVGGNLNPSRSASEPQGSSKELAIARGLMQSGNYSQAIPRLMHVTGDYPQTQDAMEAHFMLGQTYYELGGYGDAVEHFEKCLSLNPDSAFAPWCQDYLKRLTDPQGNPYTRPEFVDTQIAAVRARAESNPQELSHRLELADLYWKNGQYQEAGDLYNQIFRQWPKLLDDMVLRQRIDWTGDGVYTVLTPDEILRRRSEEEPLLVYNTTSYRSGRFEGYTRSFRETQYIVTGKVVNRGSEPLKNISLFVTIYGFGSIIYDSQRVTVGSLEPGVSRAFSSVFTNFDNLENVSRYEIQSEFTR